MPAAKKITPRHILITNMEYVYVNGVRTMTHALVLSKKEGFLGDIVHEIRGFGVDPCLPTFDLAGTTLEYTTTDIRSGNAVFIGQDGKATPLMSGVKLTFKDGISLDILVSDPKQPISVQEFSDYDSMWTDLPGKVAQFWQGPSMPTVRYVPVAQVKLAHSALKGRAALERGQSFLDLLRG